MDISGRALWICGGICAAAIVCCIALGLAVRSQGQLIDRLQVDVQVNTKAIQAADIAQAMRDKLYQGARNDAQSKYVILDGVQSGAAGLSDADYLDAMRRVYPQDTGGSTDAAGKSAAGLPSAGSAASHDADR